MCLWGGGCAKQKGKSECWGHPASFHHPCADEPTGDFLKALEVCKCEVFPAAILKHSRVTDLKLVTLSPRSWVLSGIKRGWRGLLTHSGSVTRTGRSGKRFALHRERGFERDGVCGVSSSARLLCSSESTKLSPQTWLRMGGRAQIGCDSSSANSHSFFLIIIHNFIPRSSPLLSLGSLSLLIIIIIKRLMVKHGKNRFLTVSVNFS